MYLLYFDKLQFLITSTSGTMCVTRSGRPVRVWERTIRTSCYWTLWLRTKKQRKHERERMLSSLLIFLKTSDFICSVSRSIGRYATVGSIELWRRRGPSESSGPETPDSFSLPEPPPQRQPRAEPVSVQLRAQTTEAPQQGEGARGAGAPIPRGEKPQTDPHRKPVQVPVQVQGAPQQQHQQQQPQPLVRAAGRSW